MKMIKLNFKRNILKLIFTIKTLKLTFLEQYVN